MRKLKNEIADFYKRDNSIQFSKKVWLDLFGHAMVGLAAGIVIFLIRGTDPMPTLLLLTTVIALWGLRNHLRSDKAKTS